jgi:integration host factor subunit beta
MAERTKTLTKKDVSRKVAEARDEPIYQAEAWVSAVLDAMGEMLTNADPEVRIELRGFGVFEVKKTKAKPQARNPKTNETVFIPSRRKTHFKPSKRLKDVLQVSLREYGYAIPEGSADKHLEGVSLDVVAVDGTRLEGPSSDGADEPIESEPTAQPEPQPA